MSAKDVDKVIDLTAEVKKTVDTAADTAGESIGKFIEKYAEAGKKAEQWAESIKKMKDATQEAGKSQENQLGTMETILDVCQQIPGTVGTIAGAIDTTIQVVQLLNELTKDWDVPVNNLRKANEALGLSYAEVGTAMSDSLTSISSLDGQSIGFTESIMVDPKKTAEISQQMQEIQQQILEIAQGASEQRRQLTDGEIQSIDELMGRMGDASQKQIEEQSKQQEVTFKQAEMMAESHAIELEEYTGYAQQLISSAETKNAKIQEIAKLEYDNKLAAIAMMDGLSDEEREKRIVQAQEDYQQQLTQSQQTTADTLAVLTQGYYDKSQALQDYFSKTEEQNKEWEEIEQGFNERRNELLKQGVMNESGYSEEIQRINDEETQAKAEFKERQNALLTDEVKEQLGAYMGMIANTELYGGQLSEENKAQMENFMKGFDNIPDEAKTVFIETMDGALTGLENKEGALYKKASSMAGSFIAEWEKRLEVNSPSRAAKRIFNYVMQGAEQGVDENVNTLRQRAAFAAEQVKQAFENTEIDAKDVTSKIQEWVDTNANNMSATATLDLQVAQNAALENLFKNNQAALQEAVANIAVENTANLYLDGEQIAQSVNRHNQIRRMQTGGTY